MPRLHSKNDAESLVRRYQRMLNKSLNGEYDEDKSQMYRRCLKYFSQMTKAWPEWCRDDPRYKTIYAEAKRKGWTVDHTVPLNNPIVCGLHVPWNLEPMPPAQNFAKSNHWWPDMPNAIEDMFGPAEPHQMCLVGI